MQSSARLLRHGSTGRPPSSDSQPIVHLDVALARRCVARDRDAEAELFAAHRQRVHAILYRILGSNRDMEDLVQDAFMEIYRSLANYRGEASLGTWVDRVTTRVAYRYLTARRGRRPGPEVDAELPADVDPERAAYHRQLATRLYGILERLEPKYRIAFALAVIDGRPQREVATLTGASLVAVKARVWRARSMVERRAAKDPVLRDFLARSEGGRDDTA